MGRARATVFLIGLGSAWNAGNVGPFVTQIAAVQAALRRVEEDILRDHISHCVAHAMASGDKSEQAEKIDELMDVLVRSKR